jgi:hypothetical protein
VERDEMVRILEEIARDSSNPNARVGAIRFLKQLEEAEEDARPLAEVSNLEAFRKLDELDERIARRKARK